MKFIQKYWPFFIMLFLFIFIVVISSNFWDNGVFININQGDKQIWNLNIEATYKFVSVFIALLLGTSFIFSLLLNTYKYNLIFIEKNELKVENESLKKRINSLEKTNLKLSNDINVNKIENTRKNGIIIHLLSLINNLQPKGEISNELNNLYRDDTYIAYKLEFIESQRSDDEGSENESSYTF